jgi:hypothetical protein
MNNSTKGRRVEEHDKAQKKSGYPVADSLANASSAIRRWETVASNITEGLVARGWDVTCSPAGIL